MARSRNFQDHDCLEIYNDDRRLQAELARTQNSLPLTPIVIDPDPWPGGDPWCSGPIDDEVLNLKGDWRSLPLSGCACGSYFSANFSCPLGIGWMRSAWGSFWVSSVNPISDLLLRKLCYLTSLLLNRAINLRRLSSSATFTLHSLREGGCWIIPQLPFW